VHGGQKPGEDPEEIVIVNAEQILELGEGLGTGGIGEREGPMASGADEGETAAVVHRPAIGVDFQHRVRGRGRATAEVESDDLAGNQRLAGFGVVLGDAARDSEGDGPGGPELMGDPAVEEVDDEAEESFFGITALRAVVFVAEVGCEVRGVEPGEVGLLTVMAGDQGEGNAFGAGEDTGTLRAPEE
jgi:hypothetical protein